MPPFSCCCVRVIQRHPLLLQVPIGRWLAKKQHARRNRILKVPQQQAIANAVGTELAAGLWAGKRARSEHSHEFMVAALKKFVADEKRRPKRADCCEHEGQLVVSTAVARDHEGAAPRRVNTCRSPPLAQTNLATWLAAQRANKRDGKLDPLLQQAIEDAVGPALAGGLWEMAAAGVRHTPELMCAALEELAAREGRLPKKGDTVLHKGVEVVSPASFLLVSLLYSARVDVSTQPMLLLTLCADKPCQLAVDPAV